MPTMKEILPPEADDAAKEAIRAGKEQLAREKRRMETTAFTPDEGLPFRNTLPVEKNFPSEEIAG